MIDYKERRLRFWCQKVLPLVYDESLSYYELLCKIMKHLSEAETDVSALEQWLEELDATAVKKVYSEWPLQASKDGNTVTLNNALARDLITGVNAAEDSPITVTSSGHGTTGHLDPNDDTSPMGLTDYSDVRTIDIEDATPTRRGAMSVADKQKVDRLYNTFVQDGDNIVVTSVASANGDTTYTVGVDPNFQINIQNEYLVGDWEWNAQMRGKSYATYFSSGNTVIVSTPNLSAQVDMTNTRDRLALQGAMARSLMGEAGNNQVIGCSFGAASGYPFALVNCASPVVSGETYYTTTTPIDIKCQLTGVNVGNRDYLIYLTPSYSQTSGSNGNNQYLTAEDRYFPSYGMPFIPAKYVAHADANGFFSVTIPAGLTSKAIDTASSATANQTGIYSIIVMADGAPADLKDNVTIDYMKISVKSHLV